MLPVRFLLSHNHNIPESVAPALTPAAFSTVFQTHLAGHLGDAIVSPIDHPHWRCAVETTAAPEASNPVNGAWMSWKPWMRSRSSPIWAGIN
jgi:hypothetical protein